MSTGTSDHADTRQADTRSERTRTRILDAAAYVLSRKGFAGTRLADVAQRAEFGAAAGIYYYFPSREKLIEEVMWRGAFETREHVTAALEALPADANPLDRICAAVEAHLRCVLKISDYATAATRNAGQLPAAIRARQVAEERRYGAVWRSLIKEAAEAGEIRADLEPRAARMLIVGALNWAPEWWHVRQGSVESVVHTAQSLVRHGLSS